MLAILSVFKVEANSPAYCTVQNSFTESNIPKSGVVQFKAKMPIRDEPEPSKTQLRELSAGQPIEYDDVITKNDFVWFVFEEDNKQLYVTAFNSVGCNFISTITAITEEANTAQYEANAEPVEIKARKPHKVKRIHKNNIPAFG